MVAIPVILSGSILPIPLRTRLVLLFDHLHPNFFLLFSRGGRHLYARVVTAIFEQHFGAGFLYPSRQDLHLTIYNVIRDAPELWSDDEDLQELPEAVRKRGRRLRKVSSDPAQDKLLDQARKVYGRLVDCGWLEEEVYGLRVTVDMPPAALLVAERLVALQQGMAVAMSGVVVAIRTALAAVLQADARANAAGLHKAAENAAALERSLRVVLADLRRIEKKAMGSENLEERYRTFFEDFIGEVLLKDFADIYGGNHPYRYRRDILANVERIELSDHLRDRLIEGYIDDKISCDADDAVKALNHDLTVIRDVFGNVDLTLGHIDRFRRKLEQKLTNTIRYAEHGEKVFSRRLAGLILRLDTVYEDATAVGREPRQAPALWLEDLRFVGSHVMPKPRQARQPLEAKPLERRRRDPAVALRRRMLQDYAAMFRIQPAQIAAYLDKALPPDGPLEARDLPIRSLPEFLVVDELRRCRHAPPPEVAGDFAFAEAVGRRDDEWLVCPNFSVRRKRLKAPADAE